MGVAITVRGVPSEVRDELAARATRAGKSLQDTNYRTCGGQRRTRAVDGVIARARARARRGARVTPPRSSTGATPST